MNGVQWWCSARGVSWEWKWQPYPGVWLFVAVLAGIYWWLARRGGEPEEGRESRAMHSGRAVAAVLGIVSLWLTLDWPVGTMGAGYLAGVHAIQFVMLAMVVPPLLLLGIRPAALERLAAHRGWLGFVRLVTTPLLAMVLFTAAMVITHVPRVVDRLMASQPGSFVLDMAWLLSGLVFWWPLMVRVPRRARFVPPLRMVYLFFGTLAHVFIAMWLLLSPFPVYATYELAPPFPFPGLDPLIDQQVAGGVMLLVGSPLVLVAISIIFFRWLGTGEERPRTGPGTSSTGSTPTSAAAIGGGASAG